MQETIYRYNLKVSTFSFLVLQMAVRAGGVDVMIKHYYIADSLDELEQIEQELESAGVKESHIHILSDNPADVENHHLHMVNSLQQQDTVHSAEVGALVGVIGAIFVLMLAYFMGWTNSAVGWLPFVFLSIAVLGFCTWEGGLIGIQKPNVNFAPFQQLLKEGKHLLLVDTDHQQEPEIDRIVESHPHLHYAGMSESSWGGVKLKPSH